MVSYPKRIATYLKKSGPKAKLIKLLLILFIGMVIFVGCIILFISPITKYLVEKYDYKYTGREIKIDRAYVNPFTGFVHFSNLRIYEDKSDSIFFSANGIDLNITLNKLLSKTYEISDLTVDKPIVKIVQSKKDFNFNDLITKFSSGDSLSSKAPLHFNVLNVKIINGIFYYIETEIPINYSIIKLDIESPGKSWNSDTITSKFSFSSGIGSGDIKGELTVNLKTNDYRLATVIQKFDLNIIEQYLKDLTNYGTFSANLDADLKSSGNFNSVDSVTTSGQLSINDFHFGKNPNDDYASFDKLKIAIKEVSPKNLIYFIDSLSLIHPYFKYERYDSLDNIETMFGQNGSNITAVKADAGKFNLVIEIADYIKALSKNFFRSNYNIKRLAIYNANLKFNDYAISEKFAMALDPFSLISDSIDKNNKRVNVYVKSGILPYGGMNIALSINPTDSSDFDLRYHLNKIPATLLNPYLISQTSFPFDRGTIELSGTWNVRNSMIKSENHLVIIDPRLSQRFNNKLPKWIPMRLIMAFVREGGNVIDYKIPITGSLKDPKFHFRDVIWDIIKNIFIKPVTTPYRMEVKTIETELEKSLALKWEMRLSSLGSIQEKFIKNMVLFLEKNPDAMITVSPNYYDIKEKEYILFYEAKKKYFSSINNLKNTSLNFKDSMKVDKMSIKDPLFIKYLDSKIKDTLLFTIQEKCGSIIDQNIINTKYNQLNKERIGVFMAYFKESDLEKRVKILPGENIIPYNGFTFYRIDYKGEFPESLIKAYRKMNKLNNASPRKKYKEERTKKLPQ